jgi:uracil-DNA glycosylase
MTADDLAAAFDDLPAAWAPLLTGWTAERRDDVIRCVREVSGARPIAPADPFRALRLVPPDAVKVVVFGQDPYPTAGHADGLAFSAGHGKPRSLARIFEVLGQDQPGFDPPAEWRLDAWARQGVLLLNPTLTVEVGKANSHARCGWHALTSEIVRVLCDRRNPPVFLLWGTQAQNFFNAAKPPGSSPRVLTARHPSYDFKKDFMRELSHFAATQDLVDWWAIRREAA